MKKIILFWYILLYCIYKWDYKFQKVFNYSGVVFFRIVGIAKLMGKEKFNERAELLIKSKPDPKEGLSIWRAKIVMGGVFANLMCCIVLLVFAALKVEIVGLIIEESVLYIIPILILCILLPARLDKVLFDDYKYLKSFKSFDRQDKAKRRYYGYITIAFLVFNLLAIVSSFALYIIAI